MVYMYNVMKWCTQCIEKTKDDEVTHEQLLSAVEWLKDTPVSRWPIHHENGEFKYYVSEDAAHAHCNCGERVFEKEWQKIRKFKAKYYASGLPTCGRTY